MSTLQTLDVGQANELKLAFRRTGWNNEEVKRLCEGNTLVDVRNVLLGHAEIRMHDHFIDCDPDPFVPRDWTLEEHQRCGILKWDPARVELFFHPLQLTRGILDGHHLRREIAHISTLTWNMSAVNVLNANVLDYLLAHQWLIPEKWKEEQRQGILFWGTIYRDCVADRGLCVRDLQYQYDEWVSSCYWLSIPPSVPPEVPGFRWYHDCPAASLMN